MNTRLVFTQEGSSWFHPGEVTDLFERHGAATLMLAAGIDIKIVSDTLGHSDTRITRDIYQSVLPRLTAPPLAHRSRKPFPRRAPHVTRTTRA